MAARAEVIRMRRREFVALIGSAAAWPLSARAQSPRDRPLIGYLAGGRQAAVSGQVSAFREGLAEYGYVEGRNIDVAFRFAEGRPERLPALAEELIRLKPLVMLTGAVDAAVAARNLTGTIPIVTAVLADAVNLGLVASYARPGGNVTGIMPYVPGMPFKQMELTREVIPSIRKVGLLGNLNDPKVPAQREELEEAGRKLGIDVLMPEVRSPQDVDQAMQSLAKERVDAVIILQSSMLLSERQPIALIAAANRLPTIWGYREGVDAGGLISYGIDLRWCFHHAASYVAKILKGTAPGDLPVEFPTKLQMVINNRAAKAIGITVSPLLLARADEVIE